MNEREIVELKMERGEGINLWLVIYYNKYN